jgi:hypothetical protein
MTIRAGLVAVALLLAFGLSACGESKVRVYEPGKYKGAAVEAPWNSPQFAGNRAAWESQIAARAQNQDEYSRMRAK